MLAEQFPPHTHTSFILILSLSSHQRCSARARDQWSHGRRGDVWGRGWRDWGKESRGEWQPVQSIILPSSLPSEVLIQPAEVQTTTHTCLLLSILLGARWEEKWLLAVLSLQGLFPHINTFTAWLHLLQTLKTHTLGEPGAVNDGHMQNCAHL